MLVIDLDLQFGDVALCLGLPPETMYDLAVSGGSLDGEKLADYVMAHDTGVDVMLLAPARPDQASAITIELLRDILAVARVRYDFIIADTPPGFTAR